MITGYDVPAVLETLERDGYCIVPNVLSKTQCAQVRAALDRCSAEDKANGRDWVYDDGSNQRIWALINRDEAFVPLATHPFVLTIMEKRLGTQFTLGYLHANITGPGGLECSLHIDQDYMPDPQTHLLATNAVWMIDAFTVENGATLGVPGSHKLARHPIGEEPDAKRVPMTGEEGSLLILDGRFWHQTGPNRSKVKRRGVFAYYNCYWIRSGENWTVSMPPEIRRRHPELEALCGFTSYNTIGSVNGPDMSLRPKTERIRGVTTDVQRT